MDKVAFFVFVQFHSFAPSFSPSFQYIHFVLFPFVCIISYTDCVVKRFFKN
nr:MAG TPA: hypothetical protein [Caudoviricetes sp.]